MKTKNLRTGTSLTPFYREKNRYKEIKDPCEKELGRGVAGLPKCSKALFLFCLTVLPMPSKAGSSGFPPTGKTQGSRQMVSAVPFLFVWHIPTKQGHSEKPFPRCSLVFGQHLSIFHVREEHY